MTFALVALVLAGQLAAQDAPRRPVDRDGDGKISREEFPGPAEIFQRFDTDKDGFIDAKEREAMRASRRQGRVGRGNNGGFAMQEFFRALDTDRDRQVSPKEWELLLKAADFKAADADKNGKVSPEEWFRYSGQGNRPGGGRERLERGPAQGDAAPKVTAKSVTDSKPVDLAKVTRPTVLIFGSYT
jgi:Ca2+-binding EF-hand superfamily protein